ncbi:MAG: amidohydrolase, partial [Proteobacteria bacterium]|nr:amidohydrolase [Pseudomonadota bacterium]
VATLRGSRPGRTILLRADMDALPMTEETGLPFASQHDGRMHACGHDAHVAMLAGAARLLARRRDAFAGTVKLLFQPGEEGHGGARILIGEGLLDAEPRVDAAFAIHVDSSLPRGCIATRPGPILAAGDLISIDITGRGGHASMPHLTADPIPVACEIVMALQSLVTRRIDAFDPVVITITRIQAGSAGNVIPPTANLLGTIRSVSERARETAHEGVRRVAEGIAAAHGVDAEVHVVPGYPVTINHADFAAFARGVAAEVVGEGAIIDMRAPIMGAEDFSYVLQRVPGAIVFLGARPPEGPSEPLHSSPGAAVDVVAVLGPQLENAGERRRLERSLWLLEWSPRLLLHSRRGLSWMEQRARRAWLARLERSRIRAVGRSIAALRALVATSYAAASGSGAPQSLPGA